MMVKGFAVFTGAISAIADLVGYVPKTTPICSAVNFWERTRIELKQAIAV